MSVRFSATFEPLLREEETAMLYGAGLPMEGFPAKCVSVGALPEYYADFGALTAATWDTDQTDTNLRMNTNEFAQYRMRIVTDMRLRLRNSSAVQQWRTLNTTFYLPQFPTEPDDFMREYLWRASEFFVWQDTDPVFELFSSIATDRAAVLFSGWRIKVEKLAPNVKPKFSIWLSDWPSRTPIT